ncbi:uncharacterized protein LOC112016133 [Quercus suber]|uniref:uncharacterized protein LOC112016133 n=1 Tax=Quercus suber TaxID=58331 RepID=UPI000CE16609|nr:uncharacterized protein LOC112016133 [Quercus suber]POE45396.1 zinc finger protein zat3 [Quercus suber]
MSNSKDSSSDKPSSDDQQGHHDRPQNTSDDTTMQEAENVTAGTNVEIEGDSSSVTPFMAQETGDHEGGDADDIVIEPHEGFSEKQGGQGDELGAISSGVHKPKRMVELVDPPTLRDPVCIVCSKQFGSWKAVFGHMRSHPGRHWRGVFPPPTGIWDPLRDIDQKASGPNIDPNIGPQAQEEIATTLLNVAQGVLQRLNDSDKNEGVIAISEASSSSLGRGLGIDLNQPKEKSPSAAPVLDLNKPAKEKDDDSSSDDGK